MSPNPLNDAMPPRALTARWVIRGTLTLETALHLGGEAGTERVDMPVLRDPRDGKPLLPGTTFAGALRNALADRLAGYGEAEPSDVTEIFGGSRGDDDGSQSPLIVFDAVGKIPVGRGVEIRDGVAISPATGIAEDHKKYDYEVLPAGTTFPVRVDLVLPAPGTGGDASSPLDEKGLLEDLAAALDAFAHGQSSFGAKRSRGLGRVRAVWAAKRFDLGSPEGWIEWVLSDHEAPFAANPDQGSIWDAIEAAAPDLKPLSLPGDTRTRVVIDLDLGVGHDILVRSPGTDPGAPDVSHLYSGGAAILPGTSVAGVIRTQALRIAKLLRDAQQDADLWVDRLFGPRFEGQRPTGKLRPRASRLRIGEARLEESQPQRQTRVAIDRFTGGVVDTALFDEQTELGGRATLRMELRNPEEGELGLVLLVLKDLLGGSLPVGGTSSVGRGVLRGSATVTWHEGDGKAPRSATIHPGRQPAGDAAAAVDEAICAFHKAGSLVPSPSGEWAGPIAGGMS